MHVLVCPSFTAKYAEELADAILGQVPTTTVHYPGLEGREGSFGLASAESAIASAAASTSRPCTGFGYSIGGNLLVRQVSLRVVEVDALILLAPVASWRLRMKEAKEEFVSRWKDYGISYRFDANSVLNEMRRQPEAEEALGLAGNVSCPTLILHGTEDMTVPSNHGQDLSDAIPVATFKQVPGNHFWSKKGQRDSARRHARSFLADVESQRPHG